MKRQVIIVTGDRSLTDIGAVFRRLSRYPDRSILIHGDATGADSIASEWGHIHRCHVLPVPYLDTPDLGEGGPRRNAIVIALGKAFLLEPEFYDVTVEAFPPTISRPSGTRNCMRLAKEAGLPVFVKERP